MRALAAAAVLALVLTVTAPGRAQADVDRRVAAIAAELRCPVCQNLSVQDSPSDVAASFRARIRELVLAGRSDREIEDFFVARYGEWILLSPPRRGIALAVWLVPALVIGAGLFAAVVTIAAWRRRADRGDATLPPEHLERELRALDEELAGGELEEPDYAMLRERTLRRGVARPPVVTRAAARWRWPFAGAAAATVVAVTLVPALRQRGPNDFPTGNDFAAQPETSWVVQWREAEAALATGNTETAVARYRLAVAFAPDLTDLRARYGFALASAGRKQEALAQLRRAVREDPDLPLARLYLGAVLLKAGERDAALVHWRRYLELEPRGDGARLVRRALARDDGAAP